MLTKLKEFWDKLPKSAKLAFICLLLMLVSFLAGRQSAPEKIKTVETIKTVTVEKQVAIDTKKEEDHKDVQKDTDKVVHRTILVIKEKNGTVVEKTTEDIGTKIDINKKEDKIASDTSKVVTDVHTDTTMHMETTVENYKPQWRITPMVGLTIPEISLSKPVGSLPWVFGITGERRLIGPLWGGVWATTGLQFNNATAGVALTLEF